jgi:6,7-dimethyl-8-ribityllumazine synthase
LTTDFKEDDLKTEKPVAFVQAGWHRDIVNECRDAFLETAQSLGRCVDDVTLYEVPGAFELPLFSKRLARSGLFSAVAAAGFVVDGGIYRHEFVASAVIDGLMRVQLETDIPVYSAVLTPHRFNAGSEHLEFFKSHFKIKGREVALACFDSLESLEELNAHVQTKKTT